MILRTAFASISITRFSISYLNSAKHYKNKPPNEPLCVIGITRRPTP
jgi:hypothetical protein